MGSNRRRDKNKETKKIQQGLMKDFDITEKELYKAWLAYIHSIAEGRSQKETLCKMKICKDISEKVLDYFVTLGLTMVTHIMGKKV